MAVDSVGSAGQTSARIQNERLLLEANQKRQENRRANNDAAEAEVSEQQAVERQQAKSSTDVQA